MLRSANRPSIRPRDGGVLVGIFSVRFEEDRTAALGRLRLDMVHALLVGFEAVAEVRR